MAANTNIEWCDHTFNPWTGCTKVSPGCANCYAEGWAKRSGIVTWGQGQPRRRTSDANWNLPLKWNREAEGGIENETVSWDGEVLYRRPRVFCSSLADWLDEEVPVEWLSDLIYLICKCNHLDWLLLTKRPQLWRSRLQAVANGSDLGAIICTQWLAGNPPPNVWIGTTVEDQQRADERIPQLLDIPAKVRFLSCEPLLGVVDVRFGIDHLGDPSRPTIDWVICGGESGPKARPLHPAWARDLRDQCWAAHVPFLFKQWGEWLPFTQGSAYMEKFKESRLVGNGPGPTGVPCYHVGKKAAGRLLDGREWNEFPIPL